jgi:hypothetical protein
MALREKDAARSLRVFLIVYEYNIRGLDHQLRRLKWRIEGRWEEEEEEEEEEEGMYCALQNSCQSLANTTAEPQTLSKVGEKSGIWIVVYFVI